MRDSIAEKEIFFNRVRQPVHGFYNLAALDPKFTNLGFGHWDLVIGTSMDVIVIGGGLAGLAAAVALAERGVAVTLLESRPRLGGRASSFVDQATGTAIDNCQHVSMGCCTNFRRFCETVGAADLLRTEPTLYFIGADRRINPFSASRLPAPLHLFPAFRRLSYLSRSDVRELARGLKALAKLSKNTPVSQPFDRWLKEHGQSPSVIENFWLVVLVSALSETLDRIDTFQGAKYSSMAFSPTARVGKCRFPRCLWRKSTVRRSQPGSRNTAFKFV